MACDRDKDSAPDKASVAPIPVNPVSADAVGPSLTLAPDSGPPPSFDGERAMQYVKDIVKFGPRPWAARITRRSRNTLPPTSKAIRSRTTTSPPTRPKAKFPVHNIIAKYPGTNDGIIVIASHYDTNYPLRNTSYVGANDGASSSALLLELANQLRGKAPRRLQRLAGMGRRRRGDEARWIRRPTEGNAV